MKNVTRVLALLPHPDDIEILCAGTLLALQPGRLRNPLRQHDARR